MLDHSFSSQGFFFEELRYKNGCLTLVSASDLQDVEHLLGELSIVHEGLLEVNRAFSFFEAFAYFGHILNLISFIL